MELGEHVPRQGSKRGGWRKEHKARKVCEVRSERLLSSAAWDIGRLAAANMEGRLD